MKHVQELESMVVPIRDDLTSGAAEIALQAITIFRSLLTSDKNVSRLKEDLCLLSCELVKAQPAMAPLFHLSNSVLLQIEKEKTVSEVIEGCERVLNQFEQRLCSSAAKIADIVYDLIPAGELVFAYSFSSTVVSSLLNARSKGKFFRVVCTESRPSMEGRKLANMLASAGLEVIHTFDSAMGLILPNCRAAFMGCDCVGRPGLVNKVGSWILALACKELSIPLYALTGTEKFVPDDRVFEFEDYERPGKEVWSETTNGVAILNHQFELIPFSWLSGLVTEDGIVGEKEIEKYIKQIEVHEKLKSENAMDF